MDAEVNIRTKPEETESQKSASQTDLVSHVVVAILNDVSYMSLDETVIGPNNVSTVEEYSECDTDGKKRKLNDSGSFSYQYANCEDIDDENMFRCSQCKAKFHYRCTDLLPYQIARFMVQGYRKYTCEGCGDIPKDLPEKCRRDTRLPLQAKQKQCECNIEKVNIDTLRRVVDAKNKLIASLQSTYDTQKNLIKVKDELIDNQKTIISSLTIDDNLREVISQKDHELEVLTKETENLKCIKANDADLRNTEQKLQSVEKNLRSEVQRKDDALKELEYQTSLRKSIEVAFETHKELIKSKEDIIENMKLISSLSNVTEPVKEDNELKKRY